MNSLSSHVLDTTLGLPAACMSISLTRPDGVIVETTTDADGRCKDWNATEFTSGIYQLRFHTKEYLLEHHKNAFYPFVDIHFVIEAYGGHYHIPLLISPFGFSSYRGS
jgi:5-hydroxyisourate hydrolase